MVNGVVKIILVVAMTIALGQCNASICHYKKRAYPVKDLKFETLKESLICMLKKCLMDTGNYSESTLKDRSLEELIKYKANYDMLHCVLIIDKINMNKEEDKSSLQIINDTLYSYVQLYSQEPNQLMESNFLYALTWMLINHSNKFDGRIKKYLSRILNTLGHETIDDLYKTGETIFMWMCENMPNVLKAHPMGSIVEAPLGSNISQLYEKQGAAI